MKCINCGRNTSERFIISDIFDTMQDSDIIYKFFRVSEEDVIPSCSLQEIIAIIDRYSEYQFVERLDGYWSTKFFYYANIDKEINERTFAILNTYGDEDNINDRIKYPLVPIIGLCIVRDDGIVEVADIVVKSVRPKPLIILENYMIGKLPYQVSKLIQEKSFNIFCSKRAYNFYPQDKFVSIRISDDIYSNIDDKYKHKKFEEYISGPRIKIVLESKEI